MKGLFHDFAFLSASEFNPLTKKNTWSKKQMHWLIAQYFQVLRKSALFKPSKSATGNQGRRTLGAIRRVAILHFLNVN
jgi:hypothetical protein